MKRVARPHHQDPVEGAGADHGGPVTRAEMNPAGCIEVLRSRSECELCLEPGGGAWYYMVGCAGGEEDEDRPHPRHPAPRLESLIEATAARSEVSTLRCALLDPGS